MLTKLSEYDFEYNLINTDGKKKITDKYLLIIDKEPNRKFNDYKEYYTKASNVIWLINLYIDNHLTFIKRPNHHGFLNRNINISEFQAAIIKVLSGEVYISDEIKNFYLNKKKVNLLTDKELKILIYISKGMSCKEISRLLFIKQKTVESHKYNAMKKIGVRKIAGIIKFLYDNKLL